MTQPSSSVKCKSSTTATNAKQFATTCTSSDSCSAELSKKSFGMDISTLVAFKDERLVLHWSHHLQFPAHRRHNTKARLVKNTTTAVKLCVSYPSKTVNKSLPKDYKALGKSLVHGLRSHITMAILKCAPLTNLVIKKVFRLLEGNLYSKKNSYL